MTAATTAPLAATPYGFADLRDRVSAHAEATAWALRLVPVYPAIPSVPAVFAAPGSP